MSEASFPSVYQHYVTIQCKDVRSYLWNVCDDGNVYVSYLKLYDMPINHV